MTLILELTPTAQARLSLKAQQEGEEESILASRLLSDLLNQEDDKDVSFQNDELASGTMADLFAGRTGIVSGSSEAYSENGGKRFADYVARKNNAGSR